MPALHTSTRPAVGLAGPLAALLLCAAALAGCSGDGSRSSSAGAAVDRAGGTAQDSTGGSAGAPPAAASAGAAGGAARGLRAALTREQLLTANRSIIYQGRLTVRVRSVAGAVDRVESLATAAQGLVFAEQSSREAGTGGAATATMTIKVPTREFGPTLDGIGGLGRELSREKSADDVTSKVVDVASRLATQRRSVARMQALLDQARTVGEIVRVEGDLARREADLESLEAQQKALTSLTELATIDVTLVGPTAKVAVPVEAGHLGFLSGLRGGWDALAAVLLVALTAVGAALPFAVVLALVGVPLLVVYRRRRVAPPAPAVAE